ncbi:hypothetical protein DY000_02006712 [Brassica cretica]|uniref:Uncharacterized protein n=1 Tax=Brassica cretica TaxID=69181 RepID=A0ABQ7BSM6_BRACR|nr:hypothetical protein DY000_02006712 [Brassica cretica]
MSRQLGIWRAGKGSCRSSYGNPLALAIGAVTAGVPLPVFASFEGCFLSFLKQSIDFSGGAGSVMDLGSYCS